MDMIRGGVTAAKGFEAAGAETGVKYKDRKDMAGSGSRKHANPISFIHVEQ